VAPASGIPRAGLAAALVAALTAGCRESSDAPAEPPAVGDEVTAETYQGPVTIRGRVLDGVSGAGIPGALVIVLEAGVTTQQWLDTPGEEATAALMEGTTLTDSTGAYEIAALERGGAYTVMITAQDYEPAIFEGGLELGEEDPPVTSMHAVELEPR
jgi:hypothetical protein